MFRITAAGMFLSMQLIYAGKTQRCHPKGISFPNGFDVTHLKNHRSNKSLAIQHVDNIIFLYFEVMREKLGLPEDQKFFSFMFSNHKQQVSIVSILTRTIAYVQVPRNLTYIFQPLNLNVNAFTK